MECSPRSFDYGTLQTLVVRASYGKNNTQGLEKKISLIGTSANPPATPSVDFSDVARMRGSSSWLMRHNAALTIAAATVAPVIYVAFIDRYAINSFFDDDWTVIPMVHAALHGHLSLSQLWSQHNESRLFVGNAIIVVFGFVDRLDLRSVIFFSAVALIASYAGLLILLRRYLGKQLTPIPVLVVGVIWFSLADVENAFWAFQVSWYLTVFFFVMVLVALLIPINHRMTWFAAAVFLASAASLTTIQGFLCWPIGAICLLWNRRLTGRVRAEITVWAGAAVVNLALYLPGYSFGKGEGPTCLNPRSCSTAVLLHHPLRALEFFIALIGNVIPGTPVNANVVHDLARYELVGAALLIVAVFVLRQSWRYRASSEHLPLPLLLIVFSLLFDLIITLGRGATGLSEAVIDDRFVMANLILIAGIAIYAYAHLPRRSQAVADGPWRVSMTYLALSVLAIFLIFQTVTATDFGVTNGSTLSEERSQEAQLIVYVQSTPVLNSELGCQMYLFFLPLSFKSYFREAHADQLGEFNPNSYRRLLELGPPSPPSPCRRLQPRT